MSSIEELLRIANALATGYESLVAQLEYQAESHKKLNDLLAKSINSNTSEHPSEGAISEWQNEITKQFTNTAIDTVCSSPDIQKIFNNAEEALGQLRQIMAGQNAKMKKCPVAHNKVDHRDLEKDYTTQGKPSSLECPFANMTGGGTGLDPIAAEFHQDQSSAPSVQSAGPCKVCPIRFLDKHSPEEIAKYFENHKHEIPRSHEICVKRYQQNETSIRQLDAKYGNLVSMIQALGNKHKAYLPGDENQASGVNERSSTQAVQTWAENIEEHAAAPDTELEGPPRLSRFDKPLRDIRVGESPSRPWGIPVPVDNLAAPNRACSEVDKEPKQEDSQHLNNNQSNHAAVHQEHNSSNDKPSSKPATRIIFNGPVFFGYSAESAARFLQQLDIGS